MKHRKQAALLLAVALVLGMAVFARAEGERETIQFWYHSADTVTDAVFERQFEALNAAQDKYTFEYTSFAFSDFQEKFQMAVVTDTMPDVVSLGFSNIAMYTSEDVLLPLDDITSQLDEFQNIDESLVENLRRIGGGALYGIPFAYNQEVAWYNTALFEERGIDAAPATQSEFLALCEEFANKENGTYFYSLRGVRPYDSLLAWLFTYTDGLGYDGNWFDEDGNCILARAEFVEALDAYADIYRNGYVTGDSVNNNYAEVVAEFGSGVSMYIIHNSSSESTHRNNLGEGGFASARVLANDQGHYFASGLQPNIYCIANRGEGADYAGAIALVNYLTLAEYQGELCREVGRVPCNMAVTEQDWYAQNEHMMLYADYLADENYFQIQNLYWISEFSNFINNDMTADFQAVLLNELTAQECMEGWARTIEGYQAEYTANNE